MPKTLAVCFNNCRRNRERPVLRAMTLLVACCCILLGATTALAADVPRVTLVDEGSAELTRKLHAEATYAGFEVELGKPTSTSEPSAEFESSAVVLHVTALDRVVLEFEQPDGARAADQVLVMTPSDGESFALRVVESVRARLVDLGWQVPKPRDDGSASAAVVEPTQAPAPVVERNTDPTVYAVSKPTSLQVWLGPGAGAIFAAGGFAPLPLASLSLRTDVDSTWGVHLAGVVPLSASTLERSEGQGRLLWYDASAGVHLLLPLAAPWFASGGLGGGIALLNLRGQARQGFAGVRDHVRTGSAHLELSFGRTLTQWLRLRVHGQAGLLAPRPVLRFDEREVASVGRLHGSLGLSVEGGFNLNSEHGHE